MRDYFLQEQERVGFVIIVNMNGKLMNKLLILLILFFCVNTCYANSIDLSFHQPNLGNVELYSNEIFKDLKVELKMEHSYKQESIFILPYQFYGESEYYTLGFYVDMDKKIMNEDNASNYRILYKNYYSGEYYNTFSIPEPCTLMLLGFGIILLNNKKRIK